MLGAQLAQCRIVSHNAMTVIGILQCRPYAEALLRGHAEGLSDDEVERRLDLRMRRQIVLDQVDPTLELFTVIDESVLNRASAVP